MLDFLKKRHKIKTIPEKNRHKPSIILTTTNKEKGFKRNHIHSRPATNINFKGILFGLLGIGLILGIVFLLNSFFSIKDYKIDKISVLGNKTITEAEIRTALSPYINKHITLVDTGDVESDLMKAFPIIKGVMVIKQYPNKLFIKINEREPKLVYVSLNGAYVLDTYGKILKILASQKVDFSTDKILIARGLGDLTSQFLKDYFLNEFILTNKLGEKTLAERDQLISAEYSFDKISLAQKTSVLKKLGIDFQKEMDDLFAKNDGVVLGSKYHELPEVYGVQNENLRIEDSIDMDRQNLTLELINRLNTSNMEYTQIRWEGSILVKIYLKNTKQLVFGTSRPLSEQWEDYLLVTNDLSKRGKGYSIIDLSSSKISVIN